MNLNRINRLINGMAFVFALAFGMVLISGTDVNAQGRGGRDKGKNDNRGYDKNDKHQNEQQKRGEYKDDRYDDDDRNRNNGYYTQDEDRINGRDRNGNQSTKFAYKRGYRGWAETGS